MVPRWPRRIKKYGNRRLYGPATAFITLEAVGQDRAGGDVRVVDAKATRT
jgi:polyhydroxyalkanoate synthesis regulator protein